MAVTRSFEAAREGLRKTGASVGDRELVETIIRHGEHEGELLGRYRRFADEASSPAVRYLVHLIVEDEVRHHQLLVELANRIAWGFSSERPAAATPDAFPLDGAASELARETKALLEEEEKDRSALRTLRHQVSDYEDTTLWPVVIDMMLADTDKHAAILRYILRHLRVS